MPSSPQKVKFFMYLLFFMLGIVVSVIIVTSANLSMKYSWIPFLSSTVIITLLILFFDKDEVSLRSLMLAAVSSVVTSFFISMFGIVSAAALSFQGIAALLGLSGGAAAGAAVAATGAATAVAATAVAADAINVGETIGRSSTVSHTHGSDITRSMFANIGLNVGGKRGGRRKLWVW